MPTSMLVLPLDSQAMVFWRRKRPLAVGRGKDGLRDELNMKGTVCWRCSRQMIGEGGFRRVGNTECWSRRCVLMVVAVETDWVRKW